MFDVSWTDPAQETVGQRKARRDQQSNGVSPGSSVRSSESSGSRASKASDSTLSQSKPPLFSLFSGGKKSALARSGSQSKPSALSNNQNARTSRRISSYSTPSGTTSQHTSTAKKPSANDNYTCRTSSNGDTDVSSPSDESVFSGWTGRSNNTDSSWSSVGDTISAKGAIIQPLSRTSFVTQNTEVTVSSRESMNVPEQLATIVRISATGTMPIQIHDSPSKLSPTLETFDFPVPRTLVPEKTPSTVLRDDIALSPEGWPVGAKSRQQDSWRPPDAWECPSEETVLAKHLAKCPDTPIRRSKNKKHLPPTSELTHLRKCLRRMEKASPKIVIKHLKEEWIEVADASVYRELELEKQLWMLSALRMLENKHAALEQAQVVKHSSAPIKMLSLYENNASASFLLAHSPPLSTIHHLSPNPLSPASYPNIHPLTTPSPSASLPYASNLFNSIHSIYVPAILPASSLPTILKDCHRCLSASGTLHLTILDPSPLPSTLGPRFRQWLDNHLLINLERQFRCMNPSRLFPIWLTDAGLRAEGSTITIERFLASVVCAASTSLESSQSSVDGSVLTGGEEEKRDDTRQELKSQVGRMLWKEMWGGFVEGEKWWWEDDQVLEECERVGTGWEYAVISAVKEG